MFLCMLTAAHAGVIPAWSMDGFGDGQYPADGDWAAGYTDGSWYFYDDYLVDVGDENIGDNGYDQDEFPGYGAGTAADNWLVRGVTLDDLVVTMTFINNDDDAFGLVSHHSSGESFYLLFHSQNSAPPPVFSADSDRLYLLRIADGRPSVLGSAGARLSRNDWNRLTLTVDDGQLTVALNGETEIEATDDDPLPAGRAGVYSYDNGYEDRDQSLGYIESIAVSWVDEDDDGVADDEDNCEELANEDQADADGDGLGDLCDDEPTGGDTGEPTGGDTGEPTGTSDSGLPTSDSGPGGDGTVVLVNAGCGCTTSPAAPGGAWMVLGLAGLLVRRRQSR